LVTLGLVLLYLIKLLTAQAFWPVPQYPVPQCHKKIKCYSTLKVIQLTDNTAHNYSNS
jgi:hypothetical protein